MKSEIKLEKRKPTFDYILNDLALDSLMFRVVNGIASSQDKFDFDYQIKLIQEENKKYKEFVNELRKIVNGEYVPRYHTNSESAKVNFNEGWSLLKSFIKDRMDKIIGDDENERIN